MNNSVNMGAVSDALVSLFIFEKQNKIIKHYRCIIIGVLIYMRLFYFSIPRP